jgi:hypothetical protein
MPRLISAMELKRRRFVRPPFNGRCDPVSVHALRGIPNGRAIWIADAHRGDGKRFVVHADEKLTAFVELESVIQTDRDN